MFSSSTIWRVSSIILLLFGSHGAIANKEYYSSVAGLEELLDTEVFLLAHLQSYVESMTSQLEMLKSKIVELEREHASVSEGIEEYLTSPVNAYLLIKRLHKDWAVYEQAIKSDDAQKSFLAALAFSRENLSFPTDEDSIGSAIALVRLQETYQLDISQVAAGIINGVKYGSAMSWQDCFQLGQQLFVLRDFNHTKPWLKESLERLRRDEYLNTTEIIDFLDMVAHYHQEMGDFPTALNLTSRVIEMDPERPGSTVYKKYLEDMIAQGYDPYPNQEEEKGEEKNEEEEDDDLLPYSESNEFKLYEKICRGEVKQTPSEENPLRCSYFHGEVPFRLLMPFKMEEINLDPIVVLFHDVLSDDEIDHIKKLSKPEMSRSQVRSVNATSVMVGSYRTSQSAWLKYESQPVLMQLRSKLGDISGLDMNSNEDFQVANYGIGGHYEPHFDFFEANESFSLLAGNRIATAIFYLSDVEQGGATAFPFLHKAVQPKKGSFMFWYNLHPSEENDYRTKHAACPVLKGSKWIANVWIRVRGQEFRRPCGLEQDHDISLPYQYVY